MSFVTIVIVVIKEAVCISFHMDFKKQILLNRFYYAKVVIAVIAIIFFLFVMAIFAILDVRTIIFAVAVKSVLIIMVIKAVQILSSKLY